MSKTQYRLMLVVAVMTGLVGGAVSNQLAQWKLFPQFLLPREVQVRKRFEIVESQGKRRVVLDKSGLTFFDDNEGHQVTLTVGSCSYLTLYDQDTNSLVQVGPPELLNPAGGLCVVCFAQSQARHVLNVLSCRSRPGEPKLGCGQKDLKVMWEVP